MNRAVRVLHQSIFIKGSRSAGLHPEQHSSEPNVEVQEREMNCTTERLDIAYCYYVAR